MKDIHLKAVKGIYISPEVNFNSSTGECEIKGESFLEETSNFYAPLAEWLSEYVKIQKPIIFSINLTYFNTSTSKWLLNMLHILKEYEENKGNVTVKWYYMKDDVDMEEEIDDYISDTGIDIIKIPI